MATTNPNPSPIQTTPNVVTESCATALWRTSATAESQNAATSVSASGAVAQAIPPWCTATTTPAAPARPTGVSGRRLRVIAENSCDAITAATAAGIATHHPPRSAAYSASAASGTARTMRERSWFTGRRTVAGDRRRRAARPRARRSRSRARAWA